MMFPVFQSLNTSHDSPDSSNTESGMANLSCAMVQDLGVNLYLDISAQVGKSGSRFWL